MQDTPEGGGNDVKVTTDNLAYFVIPLISAVLSSMYCPHYLVEKTATERVDNSFQSIVCGRPGFQIQYSLHNTIIP